MPPEKPQAVVQLLARLSSKASTADVLQLTKEDARRIARYGMALATKGDEAGAADAARVAIAADPDGFASCLLAGRILARAKRYREALEYYQRALKKKGQHLRALVDVAELLIALGQFTQAATYLDKVLTIDPKGQTRPGARAMALVAKTLMTVGR